VIVQQYGLLEILPFSAGLTLSQGTCNTTPMPRILHVTIHNTSDMTESQPQVTHTTNDVRPIVTAH
jgi:hypothetical protein